MHHLLLLVLPQLKVHLKLIVHLWTIRVQILLLQLQIVDHKLVLMNLRLKQTPVEQLRLALEKLGQQKVQLKRQRQRLVNHKQKLNKQNLQQTIQEEMIHQAAKQKIRQRHRMKADLIVKQHLKNLLRKQQLKVNPTNQKKQ